MSDLTNDVKNVLSELHGSVDHLMERIEASAGKFTAKYSQIDLPAKAKQFTEALASDGIAKPLHDVADAAYAELERVSHRIIDPVSKKKVRVPRDGFSKEDMVNSENVFVQAKRDFIEFIEGKEVKGVQGKVTDTLKNTYSALNDATAAATKIIDANFGHAKLYGWPDTLKHNLGRMNILDKDIAKGRQGLIAFRGGAAVVALGAIADGTFRTRTANGEDRSVVVRGLEVGGGLLGLMGTALWSRA